CGTEMFAPCVWVNSIRCCCQRSEPPLDEVAKAQVGKTVRTNCERSRRDGLQPQTVTRWASSPAEGGSDILQDRLDDMRIVVDAELIGDGEQQCVGFCDGFVRLKLLDQLIRLVRIAAAEDGALIAAEKS